MERYEIVKIEEGENNWSLRLVAKNGAEIMRCGSFMEQSSAAEMVEVVRKNSSRELQFQKKKGIDAKDPQRRPKPYYFFELLNSHSNPIGQSQRYTTQSAMYDGIRSVMKNGATKNVVVKEKDIDIKEDRVKDCYLVVFCIIPSQVGEKSVIFKKVHTNHDLVTERGFVAIQNKLDSERGDCPILLNIVRINE